MIGGDPIMRQTLKANITLITETFTLLGNFHNIKINPSNDISVVRMVDYFKST